MQEQDSEQYVQAIKALLTTISDLSNVLSMQTQLNEKLLDEIGESENFSVADMKTELATIKHKVSAYIENINNIKRAFGMEGNSPLQ